MSPPLVHACGQRFVNGPTGSTRGSFSRLLTLGALAKLTPPFGNKQAGPSFSLVQEFSGMATNNPRHGYERKRSQLKTKMMGQKHWTKRSRKTGEFMDQKKAGRFKSVRREKSAR
jgi:hypothetical protein